MQRFTPSERSNIKIEKRDDKPTAITGYAAVFYREGEAGTEYRMWSDYVERIQPGAFDRAIQEKHDARGLFNHNSERLLGRVSNGTCKLSVDSVGLRFEIPFDENDTDHKNVLAKINRGDLSGCSFAFSNSSANWEEVSSEDSETVWIRNITDLDLHDVGPVTYPAYEATEVDARNESTRFQTAVTNETQLVEARSALDAHRNALTAEREREQFEVDNRWLQIQSEQY